MTKSTIVGALIIATSIFCGGALSDAISLQGKAQVIDGRTLQIWGKRIRLSGISGPEANSPDGRSARIFLEELVADVSVVCRTTGGEFRSATPGSCAVGGVDIGQALIRAGHARPLVQQSSDR